MFGMTWPQAYVVLAMFAFAGWVMYLIALDAGNDALREENADLWDAVEAMTPVVDAARAWAANPSDDVDSADALLDAVAAFCEDAVEVRPDGS